MFFKSERFSRAKLSAPGGPPVPPAFRRELGLPASLLPAGRDAKGVGVSLTFIAGFICRWLWGAALFRSRCGGAGGGGGTAGRVSPIPAAAAGAPW